MKQFGLNFKLSDMIEASKSEASPTLKAAFEAFIASAREIRDNPKRLEQIFVVRSRKHLNLPIESSDKHTQNYHMVVCNAADGQVYLATHLIYAKSHLSFYKSQFPDTEILSHVETSKSIVFENRNGPYPYLDFGAFGEVKRRRTSALPDAAARAWDFRRFVRVRAKLDNRPAIGSGSPPPPPTAPV